MGKLQPGPRSFLCNTTFWGLHAATKHPGSNWQRVQEDKLKVLFPNCPLACLHLYFFFPCIFKGTKSSVTRATSVLSWYIQWLFLGLTFFASFPLLHVNTGITLSRGWIHSPPLTHQHRPQAPSGRWQVSRSQCKISVWGGHQGSTERYLSPEEGRVLKKSRTASRRRC